MNTQERFIYEKYIITGIAYDFTFDITEDNSGAGVADPIRLITNGTYGIGLYAPAVAPCAAKSPRGD